MPGHRRVLFEELSYLISEIFGGVGLGPTLGPLVRLLDGLGDLGVCLGGPPGVAEVLIARLG